MRCAIDKGFFFPVGQGFFFPIYLPLSPSPVASAASTRRNPRPPYAAALTGRVGHPRWQRGGGEKRGRRRRWRRLRWRRSGKRAIRRRPRPPPVLRLWRRRRPLLRTKRRLQCGRRRERPTWTRPEISRKKKTLLNGKKKTFLMIGKSIPEKTHHASNQKGTCPTS